MRPNLTLSILAAIGAAVPTADALAGDQVEIWRTPFTCGDAQFVVTSHCKRSASGDDLNICLKDQTLTLGAKKIDIPIKRPQIGKPWLYATYWTCVDYDSKKYIEITYSSGEGRSGEDEGSELFDIDLKPVIDSQTRMGIYRAPHKGRGGYIKSIMPSGEEQN